MKRFLIFTISLFVLFFMGSSAFAYYSTPGDIVVGGDVVFRIRDSAGGYSIEARVAEIYRRLIEILSYAPVNEVSITIHRVKGNCVISVGKYQLITVDKNLADANNTTPEALAKEWVKKLLPALLKAKPNR